jgi:hypothetical protein
MIDLLAVLEQDRLARFRRARDLVQAKPPAPFELQAGLRRGRGIR